MSLQPQAYVGGFGATSSTGNANYNTELAKKVFGKDPLMQPMRATWLNRFGLIGNLEFDAERPEYRASDPAKSCIVRAQNLYAQQGGADSIQCPINLYEQVNINSGFVGHWLARQNANTSTYGFHLIGHEGTIYMGYFVVRLNKWIDPKVIQDDQTYRTGIKYDEQLERNLRSRLVEWIDLSAARALLWGIDPGTIRAMYADYTSGGDFAPRAHPNRMYGKNKNGGTVGIWQGTLGAGYSMDTNDVIDTEWCLTTNAKLYELNILPVQVDIAGYNFGYGVYPVLCPQKAYFQAKTNLLVQNNVVQPFARSADGKGMENDVYGATPIEWFIHHNLLFILINKLPDKLYKLAYDTVSSGEALLNNFTSATNATLPVVTVQDANSAVVNNVILTDEVSKNYNSSYTLTATVDSSAVITVAQTKYYLTTTNPTNGLFGVIDNGNPANYKCFQEVLILGKQSLFIGDDGGGVVMAQRGITDYDELIGRAIKTRLGQARYDVKLATGNTLAQFAPSCYDTTNQVYLNFSSMSAIVYTGYVAI